MKLFIKLIVFILFLIITQLNAKTTFIYNSPQNKEDKRMDYEIEILKLALNKTIEEYGEYELKPSIRMTKQRAIQTLKNNKIKNFILKVSVSKELLNQLSYAYFPIDRGITGYRVSFISPKIKNDFEKYNTLKKIKKLTMGQGIGWLDNKILNYNGFNVKSIRKYESLFRLISLGRIDFFPRGINELPTEFNTYKDIKNLDYDKTFLLQYDFPRFFFMSKKNEKSIKRIEKGLIIAFKDGSLKKVFDKFYKKSISFIKINQRKIYVLENPFLKGLDNSYKKYNINIKNY